MESTKITWNVPEVEDLIRQELAFASLPLGAEGALKSILSAIEDGNKTMGPLVAALVLELRSIIHDTAENPTPYHLNRISSGHMVYDVVKKTYGDPEDDTVLIGTYNTDEEAQNHMTEDTEIISYDPDEWWAILDENNKNATLMLYPTKRRAMAFLLHIANPPAWKAYYNKVKEGRTDVREV